MHDLDQVPALGCRYMVIFAPKWVKMGQIKRSEFSLRMWQTEIKELLIDSWDFNTALLLQLVWQIYAHIHEFMLKIISDINECRSLVWLGRNKIKSKMLQSILKASVRSMFVCSCAQACVL